MHLTRIIIRLSWLALLAASTAAVSAPAPYYLWRSIPTGTIVCAQTLHGDGWIKASGPFRDARCKTPLIVK